MNGWPLLPGTQDKIRPVCVTCVARIGHECDETRLKNKPIQCTLPETQDKDNMELAMRIYRGKVSAREKLIIH